MTPELKVFVLILVVFVAGGFGMAMKYREATIAWLARWAAPIVMAMAYFLLMITSDTDTTGKAWMTVGFSFVLVVWFLIITLATRAALARAMAVGDIERILEVTDRELARKANRDPVKRAPLQCARAFAFELRGEHLTVLTELEGVSGSDAAARRARALVELDRVAEARREVDTLPPPTSRSPSAIDQMIAQLDYALARGRVLLAEGQTAAAKRELQAIVINIRATTWQRDTAKRLIAKPT